jgi:hypothetical protein
LQAWAAYQDCAERISKVRPYAAAAAAAIDVDDDDADDAYNDAATAASHDWDVSCRCCAPPSP